MKRIFDSSHIKHMEEFLSSNLSSIIRIDMSLTRQATKLLLLMDAGQLSLLTTHFGLARLTEEQVDQQLRRLGFLSRINLFEKKAMLADISKRRLIRTIKENHRLLTDTPHGSSLYRTEGPDSELVYTLLKQLFNYKLTVTSHIAPTPNYDEPEFDFMLRERPTLLLGVNKDVTFHRHLAEDVLPEVAHIPEEVKRVKMTKSRPRRRKNEGPTAELEATTDPSAVLRRKKALYYEPSGPIDYHTSARLRLGSVRKQLKQWKWQGRGEGFNLYEEFDLRTFVDQVVFTNNGLPVPTEATYASLREFRAGVGGMYVFRKRFLPRELAVLILKQDAELSVADALLIAAEIRPYLTIAELEYFYGIYRESRHYRADKTVL